MQHNKRHLALIGMMGTGKTTVGRAVSELLDMTWRDTDQELVAKWGCSVAEFFARYGEERFREEETAMLRTCLEEQRLLLTTGGGIILREQNRQLLTQWAYVVHLDADPDEIIERLRRSEEERPLLRGDLSARVHAIYKARRDFYRFADLRVDTTGRAVSDIAEEIARAWREHV